jgi:hypothetical protein
MPEKTLLIACAIFRKEYDRLPADLRRRFDVRFLDSLLHMVPEELDRRISELLPEPPRPFVLLYGDCSPHIREFLRRPAGARAAGCNCIEIILGGSRYKKLRKAGSFVLMPEWTDRWEEVFKRDLGLSDPGLAKDFMRENATELVYVDTGGREPPRDTLAAASAHLGLPVRIETAGLENLESSLRSALAEASGD